MITRALAGIEVVTATLVTLERLSGFLDSGFNCGRPQLSF
jgi:hypothetical protein